MKNFLMIIREYLRQPDSVEAMAHSAGLLSVGVLLGALMPSKARKPIQAIAALGVMLTLIPVWSQLIKTACKKPYSRDL